MHAGSHAPGDNPLLDLGILRNQQQVDHAQVPLTEEELAALDQVMIEEDNNQPDEEASALMGTVGTWGAFMLWHDLQSSTKKSEEEEDEDAPHLD